MFFSEVIRSRKITIARAAELSGAIIDAYKTVQDETQLLEVLSELEKDFDEVFMLKEALQFGQTLSETKIYEKEIREYAADLFARDMVLSAAFLQDARQPGATIQQLCLKYPYFSNFLASRAVVHEMAPAAAV